MFSEVFIPPPPHPLDLHQCIAVLIRIQAVVRIGGRASDLTAESHLQTVDISFLRMASNLL